jgi:hypothetical protein
MEMSAHSTPLIFFSWLAARRSSRVYKIKYTFGCALTSKVTNWWAMQLDDKPERAERLAMESTRRQEKVALVIGLTHLFEL